MQFFARTANLMYGDSPPSQSHTGRPSLLSSRLYWLALPKRDLRWQHSLAVEAALAKTTITMLALSIDGDPANPIRHRCGRKETEFETDKSAVPRHDARNQFAGSPSIDKANIVTVVLLVLLPPLAVQVAAAESAQVKQSRQCSRDSEIGELYLRDGEPFSTQIEFAVRSAKKLHRPEQARIIRLRATSREDSPGVVQTSCC